MFHMVAVDIERNVDCKLMAMPSDERAIGADGLVENHDYVDIRGISPEEAIDVINEEAELLDRLAKIPAEDQETQIDEIGSELIEDFSPLREFDLGVAGLVNTLSSIGCVPISSCNGGALGDFHELPHPWVIFHAPPPVLGLLLKAAEQADTGLINNMDGMLEIFADDIRKFNAMARYLTDR